MLELNEIYEGDCLEVMKKIDDKSIDMILCDLPYGTTACKWDTIIPLNELWNEYKRIIKDDGAIILTGSQPFTSILINSNINMFKYCWIWNKKLAGNAIVAKKQPLKIHEDICVFENGKSQYRPIMRTGIFRKKNGIKNKLGTFGDAAIIENDQYYPTSIIEFSNAGLRKNKLHLTQKPVELFKYLIKTYTNENMVVLDNCIGSGTTAIACLKTGRYYIGIEKEHEYVEIAKKRIKDWCCNPN